MRKSSAGFILISLWLLSTAPMLFGQSPLGTQAALLTGAGISENQETRRLLSDALLAPALNAILVPSRIYNQEETPGVRVAFDVRRSDQYFYLIFRNEQNGQFPTAGRGNYIIKRDLTTGEIIQMKIFLLNDEGSFLRIYPDDGQGRMEVSLFNKKIYKEITLAVPFEDLMLSPLSKILKLSESFVDWKTLLTDTSYQEWKDRRQDIARIRENLYLMDEVYDGALNEWGEFVYINSGSPQLDERGFNCSGFSKWVADGYYAGLMAQKNPMAPYLSCELLKIKHTEIRGKGNSWTETRENQDPYFALDWTRNTAVQLYQAFTGSFPGSYDRFDVTKVPFFNYAPQVGYPVKELLPLMYLLAVKNPGSLYFGAVNTPLKGHTSLRLYHHVVVLYPYFDEKGDFQLALFETGEENLPESLISRYPDSYLHLVRYQPQASFIPPPLK